MPIYERVLQKTAGVSWEPLDNRWFSNITENAKTFAGFGVSPDMAMRVSGVFACVSLIAETVASLPCTLYRREADGGRTKAREHRVYKTLRHRPVSRRRLTPMDWFGGGQFHLGLRGAMLAEIVDDGQTLELPPMHPDLVEVQELDNGRVRYRFWDPLRRGEPRTLSEEQVLHVRDIPLDGVNGIGRAMLAREAIAVAAAGEAFVGGFFKNDATGRLVVQHPDKMSAEKRKEFREMVQENYAGWANRSKTMLLTHGAEAVELGRNTNEGFITDPRNFQIADIARFWRVPLFMIGLEEKSTTWGTGIEAQKQGFVDFTIKPWTDRWVQHMQLALLDDEEQDEFFIDFNFKDLVRGDLKTRMETYKIGIDAGIINSNEARTAENMSKREGGDVFRENSPGTAPGALGPGPQREVEETDEEGQATPPVAVVPPALLEDATDRIVSKEMRDIGKRVTAIAAQKGVRLDVEAWNEWAGSYVKSHARYVGKVLKPLGDAYGVEPWVLEVATFQLIDTLTEGLRGFAGDIWLDERAEQVKGVVENAFSTSGEQLTTADVMRMVVAMRNSTPTLIGAVK